MSKTVIAEGKTLNEAIDNGLKALNCKRSDVEVKEVKDDIIHVDLIGEDSLNLIGYRGEVLNSLQTILIAVLKKEKDSRVKLYLNVGDYREKRNDILKELARKIEAEVLKNRKKRVLEPMSAYERKVIHTELQNSDKVITFSIGEEPHRRLVIDLK